MNEIENISSTFEANNRYYIYRGHDKRIIGIREYRHWYLPVKEFKYQIYDGVIKSKIFEDIHNYGYNIREGQCVLVFRQQYSEYTLNKCILNAKELVIWENFENFVLRYTNLYTSRNPIDMMNDFYLFNEIEKYMMTGNVGPLIRNLQTLDEYNYSIDDIIQKELTKIEDKKNIISFINTQRNNLKKLIFEEKHDEALRYIKSNKDSW